MSRALWTKWPHTAPARNYSEATDEEILTQPCVVAALAKARLDRDDVPRHLRIAIVNAQRAFEKDDLGALATINEDIQGLVDAAIGYARRRARI